MPRAHNHKVTFAYVDTLRSRTSIKIVVGDRIAVVQAIHAFPTRDIEQHAATNHLITHIFDSEVFSTIYRNICRWKSVIHLVIQKDVAQGVPLRAALTG